MLHLRDLAHSPGALLGSVFVVGGPAALLGGEQATEGVVFVGHVRSDFTGGTPISR